MAACAGSHAMHGQLDRVCVLLFRVIGPLAWQHDHPYVGETWLLLPTRLSILVWND